MCFYPILHSKVSCLNVCSFCFDAVVVVVWMVDGLEGAFLKTRKERRSVPRVNLLVLFLNVVPIGSFSHAGDFAVYV